MNKLTILINNEIVFEFDSELTFSEQQLAFLDKMDSDMVSGIKIQGELLVNPDGQQRATFIAMNLITVILRRSLERNRYRGLGSHALMS